MKTKALLTLRAALKLMRAERATAQRQVEALDCNISAIQHLLDDQVRPVIRRKTLRKTVRKTRRRKVRKTVPVAAILPKTNPAQGITARLDLSSSNGNLTDAMTRRGTIFGLIDKSPAGLTMADIRVKTPHMKPGDRGNALQSLKLAGTIRRVGNSWVKANPAAS